MYISWTIKCLILLMHDATMKFFALYWGTLYKETEGNCSRLMAIRNYLCQQHVHVTECNVLSVCISAVTVQHNLQLKTKIQRKRVVFAFA